MKPLKLTALHHTHVSAGAAMTEEDGWLRPERYQGAEEEVAAARERAGIADTSPHGKLDVKGSAAASFAAATLRFPASPDVEAVNTAVGMLAVAEQSIPVRCCRLATEHLLLLTRSDHAAVVRDALTGSAAEQERVHVTDVTSVLAGISVIGPRSRAVLRKLTALDIGPAALPDGACAETGLAGVHALLLRADQGGLLAYELYVTRDVAEFVWDALLDAGREFGIAPIGTQALRRLLGS